MLVTAETSARTWNDYHRPTERDVAHTLCVAFAVVKFQTMSAASGLPARSRARVADRLAVWLLSGENAWVGMKVTSFRIGVAHAPATFSGPCIALKLAALMVEGIVASLKLPEIPLCRWPRGSPRRQGPPGSRSGR